MRRTNTDRPPPRHALLQPYLDELERLPFARRVRLLAGEERARGQAVDALIEIVTASGSYRLPVEHQGSHLEHAVAARLMALGQQIKGLLVLAPYVGKDMGDRFIQAGLNFMDLVGNCHLALGDRYLAHVQGRRPPVVPVTGKGLRAASYQVLFALLAQPESLDGSARELAALAGGVSPQTASDLRRRLVELGFVERSRRHHRWAAQGLRRARDLWLAGFVSTLLPHLLIGRFRARETALAPLEARLARDLGRQLRWAWGGGAASQRLTGYYRGDQTCLYLLHAPRTIAEQLALVRDVAGPITLLRAPCPLALAGPRAQVAHPLLVYADLLSEGHERAHEAAQELLTRFLAPAGDAP